VVLVAEWRLSGAMPENGRKWDMVRKRKEELFTGFTHSFQTFSWYKTMQATCRGRCRVLYF
jgi:hypothetical protein